jgi:hypothetical protein
LSDERTGGAAKTPQAARRLARARAAAQRVPGQVWALLAGLVLFAAGFASVVLPLFQAGGTDVHAEVAGVIPDHATAGQPLQVPVALDNTSGAVISPLCVVAKFDAPVVAREVRFAGLDTVPFVNGRSCGGKLSGGEVVSAVVVFVPSQPGLLHVRLVAAQGDRIIGPELTGTIDVSP